MSQTTSVATENTVKPLSRMQKKAKVNDFYDSIADLATFMSSQDLNVAMEALRLAEIEVKQREKAQREIVAQKRAETARLKREQQLAAEEEVRRLQEEEERLQHIEEVTCMDLPLDWENIYLKNNEDLYKAKNIDEAFVHCLDMFGAVDIEYIAAVTDKTPKEVILALKGTIFQNPLTWNECFYKGWETAEEYISGNLSLKLAIAKEANDNYNGYFSDNVLALAQNLNPLLDIEDIYITLGSPWVPGDVIDEFIKHLVNDYSFYQGYDEVFASDKYHVRHDEVSGVWEIPEKTRFRASQQHGLYEELNYSIYGTRRKDMLYLLEDTLNMKTPEIFDAIDMEGKVLIRNQQETVKVLEKQEKLIAEFKSWVWLNPQRKERLRRIYSTKFGNIRKRVFDGSFLKFPEMNKEISLYKHQRDAVARMIMTPNTLLAHDVGTGKTYEMIAAGMELKRMGRSDKNLYVVPNNIIKQWEASFKYLYPKSNVLVVTIKNFDTKNRSATLHKIMEEDFDAILMTYSCFDMLSLSTQYYEAVYKENLQRLEAAEKELCSPAYVKRKKKSLAAHLQKVKENCVNSLCDIPFDSLGITTLFVDEAHNYKNVELKSAIHRMRGLGNTGSEKCKSMMDKVHCVQRQNNGGRVIFATGTPITNSIADIFVMQKYLQSGELDFLGLYEFDSWAGMFAEKSTEFEIDVDTNSYHLATRFNKFRNVPELAGVLSSIADFHHNGVDSEIPEFEGYTDIDNNGSEAFAEFLHDISNRADDIRQKRVDRKKDNLLKVTSDGRKAALDMRLIDTVYGLEPECKIVRCAERILDEYEATRDIRGVQLVFCDSSTPKQGFNLYDELKTLLVASGIPEKEIVFIHDADDETKKEKMFQNLRSGEHSVIVGSTFKLGIGVNIQERLTALHHLDVPWRPADMVQREGRILRRGNLNKKVKIFRYITKGSFDAYSWQLLEKKQRFISQILSGSVQVRSGNDVDSTVLDYAEVKALALGNPLIKKKAQTENELDRYKMLSAAFVEKRNSQKKELAQIPEMIETIRKRITNAGLDKTAYDKQNVNYPKLSIAYRDWLRKTLFDGAHNNIGKLEETFLLDYYGFQVIVPINMQPRIPKDRLGEVKQFVAPIPYVQVRGYNTYELEIESEQGVGRRLNNLLANLQGYIDEQKELLERYLIRQNALQEEVKRPNEYLPYVEKLQAELKQINEELGLDEYE